MIEVRLPSGLMVQTGYSQWAEPVGCNPDVPVGKWTATGMPWKFSFAKNSCEISRMMNMVTTSGVTKVSPSVWLPLIIMAAMAIPLLTGIRNIWEWVSAALLWSLIPLLKTGLGRLARSLNDDCGSLQ